MKFDSILAYLNPQHKNIIISYNNVKPIAFRLRKRNGSLNNKKKKERQQYEIYLSCVQVVVLVVA